MEKLEELLKEFKGENLYTIVNSSEKDSDDKIRKNTKKMKAKYHPDINKATNAVDMFNKIQSAFDILSNIDNRALYDLILARRLEHTKRHEKFNKERKDFADNLNKREQINFKNQQNQTKNNTSNQNTNYSVEMTDNIPKIKIKSIEEKLNERGIKIKWNKTSDLLFDNETIHAYFDIYGKIDEIKTIEDENKAYILFNNSKSIQQVLNERHNTVIQKFLKIKKYSKKIENKDFSNLDTATLNLIKNSSIGINNSTNNKDNKKKEDTKTKEEKINYYIDDLENNHSRILSFEEYEKLVLEKLAS